MPDAAPVVASYCATFLKPEMLHIYRQITALRALPADRHRAETRGNGAVSVRADLHRWKTGDPFSAPFLVSQLRDAPWQISRREVRCRLSACSIENDAQLVAHLFRPHRGPSPAAHSRIGQKPTRGFVSRRRRYGRPGQAALSRGDAAKCLAAARLVLVRSQSLARAVAELGCAARTRFVCTAPEFRSGEIRVSGAQLA